MKTLKAGHYVLKDMDFLLKSMMDKGMGQKIDLAKATGLSYPVIASVNRTTVTFRTAYRVAKALDVPMDSLFIKVKE